MLCKNCNKKSECKSICKDLEEELRDRKFERAQFVEIPYPSETIDYIRNKNKDTKCAVKYKGKNISVDDALAICTDKQRECIILYYGLFGEVAMTQQEIADKLNISEPAVSKRLSLAYKKIRKKFKKL